MTTATADYQGQAGSGDTPEPRILLRGVGWEVYAALRDAAENSHVRMTYDRGTLEMMSPSQWHELLATLVHDFIRIWTTELDLAVISGRTMTFRREDLHRGIEPDNCYYIEHEPAVRGKMPVDLAVDPPPDLAVEIEVTSSSLAKLGIYAAFRVPEVWRCDGRRLDVYELDPSGIYVKRNSSRNLPGFPLSEAERLLGQALTVGETALLRTFRDGVARP